MGAADGSVADQKVATGYRAREEAPGTSVFTRRSENSSKSALNGVPAVDLAQPRSQTLIESLAGRIGSLL